MGSSMCAMALHLVLLFVRAEYINFMPDRHWQTRHCWLRSTGKQPFSLLCPGVEPLATGLTVQPVIQAKDWTSHELWFKKTKTKKTRDQDWGHNFKLFTNFSQPLSLIDKRELRPTSTSSSTSVEWENREEEWSAKNHTRCNLFKFSCISLLPLSGQFSWQVKHPIKRRREICSNAQSCHENNKDSGVIGILEPYHFVALFVVTIFTKTLYSTCTCSRRMLTKDKR